ncbi:MAG: glycosyltransferase [Novosphingobium sp.]
MRILFLYGHNWGGSFVVTQAEMLTRGGHEVAIICPSEGPFAAACRNRGLRVHVSPFQGAKLRDIPRILRSMADIVRYVRGFRPDVLHCHLIKAIIVGRICGWLGRAPRRYSQLGGPLSLEMARFRWLDLATAFLDTRVICPSLGVRQLYRRHRITRGKTALLYYGFDQQRFASAGAADDRRTERCALGLAEDDPVIVLVAHMYPAGYRRFRHVSLKGHETLIAAAAEVLVRHPRTKFLVVGEDPGGDRRNFDRLRSRAEASGVGPSFVFTGFRDDVEKLIALADVAVVPSLSENCGGAVEPFAAEIPVVASDTGGLSELVLPGLTGFRFRAGDPIDLARALGEALTASAAERQRLGRNGQRLVAGLFDPVACREAQLSIYAGGQGQEYAYRRLTQSLLNDGEAGP